MKNLSLLLIVALLLPALAACKLAGMPTKTSGAGEPEKIQIISVPLNSLSRSTGVEQSALTGGFPFISQQPQSRFKGKFHPAFYEGLEKRGVRAAELDAVDFWRLKDDPRLYDVIYSKGMLLDQFKLRGKGFLESIAYSLNIPVEQLAILRDWVEGGGVLWLEPAIYVSSYDYKFKKMDDARLNHLVKTLSDMNLEGHRLNVFTERARRTDDLHMEPLSKEISFGKGENPGEIAPINDQVRSLLLQQTDYVGIYINIQGTPIISSGGRVYASYLPVGKGKIITLTPFDYQNSYYDGELFRILLLSWALEGKN
jgi:hypothetical protein